MCERLSIQRHLSTAFHPQSDGSTERANQEVECTLRVFTTYGQNDWVRLLPIVAVAINNYDASATGISPFFFTHGYHVDLIRLDKAIELRPHAKAPQKASDAFISCLQDITDWAMAAIASAQDCQQEQANRTRQAAPVYHVGDMVWLNLRNVPT